MSSQPIVEWRRMYVKWKTGSKQREMQEKSSLEATNQEEEKSNVESAVCHARAEQQKHGKFL